MTNYITMQKTHYNNKYVADHVVWWVVSNFAGLGLDLDIIIRSRSGST